MGLLPKPLAERIQYSESHLGLWTQNSVAIGSSAPEITALTTKTTDARAKLTAQQEAQEAARIATSELRQAVDAMTVGISDLIKKVRAKAATGGEAIYNLAGIPAPATPSPKPAPGQPTDLKVKLTALGALDMSWKCVNPVGAGGTTYNLFRRVGASGEFTYIGGTGVREFTDDTAPAGAALIMYKIQAVRSTTVGPFATFNVFLGVSSSGATMIESVVSTTSPKMAA